MAKIKKIGKKALTNGEGNGILTKLFDGDELSG